MSFVLYELETTGLAKRFDQIVHFAAVRTDQELRIVDRVQFRCRLMPHIIPSPEAVLSGFSAYETDLAPS